MAELQKPRFKVTLVGQQPFEVTVGNGAQVQFELESAKRGWPDMDKASTLWSSYVCWVTARRDGLIQRDMPFDMFVEDLDSVEFMEAETAEPFPAGESDEAGRGHSTGDQNSTQPVDAGV